jgi:hypothetical protein
MPEIILDVDAPVILNEIILSGIMLFPSQKDTYRRHRYLAAVLHNYMAKIEANQSNEELQYMNDGGLCRFVSEHVGWSKFSGSIAARIPPDKTIKLRMRNGHLTGRFLLQRTDFGEGHAESLFRLTSELAGREIKGLKSEKEIASIIRKTAPAAHLWTAWYLSYLMSKRSTNHRVAFGPESATEPMPLDSFSCPIENTEAVGLLGFVTASQTALRNASKTFPNRGPRQPVLPTEDAWRVDMNFLQQVIR